MSASKPVGHIVLALTGASGAPYAACFLEKAAQCPQLHLSIILSPNALSIWELEVGTPLPQHPLWRYWDAKDFSAPFASGSRPADAMLILPCSMGTVGRIAQGISDDLITRAADVQLKENRPLILVPRESPLNHIHLRNLSLLAEAGAHIVPAAPSFYHRPYSLQELIAPFVARLLYLCGAMESYTGPKWGDNISCKNL